VRQCGIVQGVTVRGAAAGLTLRRYSDTSSARHPRRMELRCVPWDTSYLRQEPTPSRERSTSAFRTEIGIASSKALARMGTRIVSTVPLGLFGLALIVPP
jgi:hypothetical protein